jgi:lipoyl-dependent peroxiredoxin
MPVARRQAEVIWEGPLARGTGTLTSGSGALEQLRVSWASRTERPDGKTSPEELIAGAHASCFAMALALVLDENKTPPERLTLSAACTLDEVEGASRTTTVELTARAQVHGLEAAAFEQMVGRAADLCPVSNALGGNVEISVRSQLAPGAEFSAERQSAPAAGS